MTLYLAPSPIHGRGVFTDERVEQGEVFHRADVLVMTRADVERTGLWPHVYDMGGVPGLPMSLASMVNHARPGSVTATVDLAGKWLTLTATRPLNPGDEVTLDYLSHAVALRLE
jgi:hypothetical protein